MSHRKTNEPSIRDPLEMLGRAPIKQHDRKTLVYANDFAEDGRENSLGLVESVRTHLSNKKALGEMARRQGKAAIAYRSQTLELRERLTADVQQQRLLNSAQEIVGQLESASLNVAARTEQEQIATTTSALAECNRLQNQCRQFVLKEIERGEFDEDQAAELDAVHEMLSERAKRSILDRHVLLADRRDDQFEHATVAVRAGPRGHER